MKTPKTKTKDCRPPPKQRPPRKWRLSLKQKPTRKWRPTWKASCSIVFSRLDTNWWGFRMGIRFRYYHSFSAMQISCWKIPFSIFSRLLQPFSHHLFPNFLSNFFLKLLLNFFLDFLPKFFLNFILDFFPEFLHCWSHISKAHSWVEVLKHDQVWFVIGFFLLFIAGGS